MAMELFGVHLFGLSAENARKLLLSGGLLLAVMIVRFVLRMVLREADAPRDATHDAARRRFWMRQGLNLLTTLVLVFGLISIWFDDPGRFATAAGLVTAGVAVALQRVITSFAAYLIILRGRVFTVGDRITLSGVRGDVVALGLMQTSVMEMGEPPSMQSNDPSVWVQARQYTGRIVRITNDKIFDAPVYNYTREFPYLWEEIRLPISYNDDHARAESILLEATRRHTADIRADAAPSLAGLQRRFYLAEAPDPEPRVFLRLTDNWIELAVRFMAREHGVRGLKDAISRDVLAGLKDAGIGIASGTYEIVGIPPIRIERMPGDAPAPR